MFVGCLYLYYLVAIQEFFIHIFAYSLFICFSILIEVYKIFNGLNSSDPGRFFSGCGCDKGT